MNKIFSISDDLKHYYFYFLGIKFSISKRGFKKFVPPEKLKENPILFSLEGNNCIYNLLNSNNPCLVSRYGCVELMTIEYYLKYKDENGFCKFPQYIKDNMRNQTGFFTPSDEQLSKYSLETLNMIKNIDVLGVWGCFNKNSTSEEILLKDFSSNLKIISMNCIGPFPLTVDNPWMKALKGKRVLVIHPFEKSILSQYQKREKLYENQNILPEFHLETIKAVQGIDTNAAKKEYSSWFEALNFMYKEIDKKDFDIALIAAGAFGTFLANYVKQKGKQAVVVGGCLQLLFGIKGTRWTKEYGYFYNKNWVSPLDEECPKDLTNFLKGEKEKAYW